MQKTYFKRAAGVNAFTLAEVLITLSIIGIVAAITMPILITNLNERINSERQANIVYKITQAMEHMRATGTLTSYDSTESFVNELQKHLKVAKRCDKDHIVECWPTEKVTKGDGTEYNVADAKTGSDLTLTTTTNNVGLILADGASIILNYDSNFQGLDIGDRITASSIGLPSGNGKTKVYQYTTTVTGPVSFVMDVNGKNSPNSETRDDKYNDIRSFGGAQFAAPFVCTTDEYGGTCVNYIGTGYNSIDCSNPNGNLYKFCSPTPSGYTQDYWAGAKYKCATMNMKLPSVSDLQAINTNKSHYSSIASNTGWFWSSEENGDESTTKADFVGLITGTRKTTTKNGQGNVICINK